MDNEYCERAVRLHLDWAHAHGVHASAHDLLPELLLLLLAVPELLVMQRMELYLIRRGLEKQGL